MLPKLHPLTACEWSADALHRKVIGQVNWFVDDAGVEKVQYSYSLEPAPGSHACLTTLKPSGKTYYLVLTEQGKTQDPDPDVPQHYAGEVQLLYKDFPVGWYVYKNGKGAAYIQRMHKKQFHLGVGYNSHQIGYWIPGGSIESNPSWELLEGIDFEGNRDFSKWTEKVLETGWGPLTKDLGVWGFALTFRGEQIGLKHDKGFKVDSTYEWFVKEQIGGICQISTL